MPMTKNGYDGVFTVVDRFSHFVQFIPYKSMCTVCDVASMFFNKWVCKYEVPWKIISDRETHFLVYFGLPQCNFWVVKSQCLVPTTPKLMVCLRNFTGLLSRYWEAVWGAGRMPGMLFFLSMSLQLITVCILGLRFLLLRLYLDILYSFYLTWYVKSWVTIRLSRLM